MLEIRASSMCWRNYPDVLENFRSVMVRRGSDTCDAQLRSSPKYGHHRRDSADVYLLMEDRFAATRVWSSTCTFTPEVLPRPSRRPGNWHPVSAILKKSGNHNVEQHTHSASSNDADEAAHASRLV